jgi:hypothetical protein
MTVAAAAGAESAPLSFDAAVASLIPADPTAPEGAADAGGGDEEQQQQPNQDPPAESRAEDASEPAEATAEGEEGQAKDEPETPALDPPALWDDAGKAAFAALPREHQETILAQVGKQAANASKAIEQAAEARKAAEGHASKVTQLADALNGFLPKAMETFKGRWEGVNWVELAQVLDPQQYQAARAQYEAEAHQLEQINAATQHAEQLAYAQHIQTVNTELPTVAPDLADPKEGNARVQKVLTFLNGRGYEADRLKHVSAEDLAIAYDAMRWREAQANAKTATKPAPKPAALSVKPTAAQGSTSTERSAAVAKNRFAQTRSVDDAVAYLLSKG